MNRYWTVCQEPAQNKILIKKEDEAELEHLPPAAEPLAAADDAAAAEKPVAEAHEDAQQRADFATWDSFENTLVDDAVALPSSPEPRACPLNPGAEPEATAPFEEKPVPPSMEPGDRESSMPPPTLSSRKTLDYTKASAGMYDGDATDEDDDMPLPATTPPQVMSTQCINARLYRIFKPRKNGEYLVAGEFVKMWEDKVGGGRQKVQSLFERSGYSPDLWLLFHWQLYLIYCKPLYIYIIHIYIYIIRTMGYSLGPCSLLRRTSSNGAGWSPRSSAKKAWRLKVSS